MSRATPNGLSPRSQRLWRALTRRNAVSPGRRALLRTALEALDRADEARELVTRDGLVLVGGAIARVHPAARVEREARGQFLAAWRQLGLAYDQARDGQLDDSE